MTLIQDAFTATLGALLLAAAPAAAQEAADAAPDSPAVFQEELSVTGRALASGATSVTVIDRETIEAANVRTVAELVRDVAGVQVTSYGSRGGHTTARIRGGDTNFTLVLLDGVPLNNPTDVQGGTFNLGSLPVAHVERIEIVRGPHSYYFGSSAMAGVINVVSRRGAGPTRFEAEVEGGEASLFRTAASVSGSAGRGDYFVGVGWEEEVERIAAETFAQGDVQANFTVPLGERSTFRAGARYSDGRADDYPDASGGPVFGSGELRSSDHRQLTLGTQWSLAGGEARRQTVTASFDRQLAGVASPAVEPQVPRSVEETRYTRSRLGWLATVELKKADRGEGLRFTGGVDVEGEDATNRSTLFLPPFLGGDVTGDYELARTTPGVFAEIVAERGQVLAEAGVRADLPEGLETQWSPRLGLTYRFGESGVRLRASWSRAFKLPSFFALASPRALGGNPDLLPEESAGVDLGVEVESRSGKLEGGLGLFSNRYENLIDFDFDLFSHVNRARVEADGVELFVRWNPGPALSLRSDLYWQDVEDPGSSQPVLHQPEWIASARLVWKPVDALRVALAGRYMGGSLDVQIPVRDRFGVDAYSAFDLALTWDWTERWQVRVRLENLTDEAYEHFIGFPEPDRSARLGLRYRLR